MSSSSGSSSTGGTTCGDHAQDGDESDLDCGGSCTPCTVGAHCDRWSDCFSTICQAGVCVSGASVNCSDRTRDGDETGVDCGGSCPSCGDGAQCLQARDCDSGACVAGACFRAVDAGPCACVGDETCVDGVCEDVTAWYPFDEDAGTFTADATGRGRNGTLTAGTTFAAGEIGGGIGISGTSNGFGATGFSSTVQADVPYTFELWLNPAQRAGLLVAASSDPNGGGGWCWGFLGFDANGHVVAQSLSQDVNDTPRYIYATDPGTLPLGTWTHIAMTWTAIDGVTLYRDGAVVATGTPPTTADRHFLGDNGINYLYAGSVRGGTNYCWWGQFNPVDFNGRLDELKFFKRALSAEEIARDAAH